jgi:hypothetical protein
MTTPQPQPRPFDEVRDAIAENARLAILYAENAENYAVARDDHGLEYAVRRLAAHAKTALLLVADIKQAKAQQAAAAHEREATS